MAAPCDFDALSVLLKASSKDVVVQACNDAVTFGFLLPDTVLSKTSEQFGTSQSQTKKMMKSLTALMKAAIFHGYTDATQLQSLFPKDFHKNLRDLLIKIMLDNMNNWKNQAVNNQVSLPRLVDFDWRVDIKTSSDTITRMAVPTCILQMKVQENADKIGNTQDVQNVNVELSRETLDTMLDGLSKIRDQLSSVAKR